MIRGALPACLCAATLAAQSTSPRFPAGVASGEVTAYSAVLWTYTRSALDLEVELARDAAFSSTVFRASTSANAANGFTAKVEAWPLVPSTTYYYRWKAGFEVSDTGRFRTAPAASDTAGLRFVFAGDSDGTRIDGRPAYNEFEVLDAARREDPDFFVYLGDTVYTDSGKRSTGPAATLDEYRAAYLQNRTYPALLELMRSTSTYAVWDDHEFRNDFYPDGFGPALYRIGRQAFLEWMPVRDSFLPTGVECAGPPMLRVIRWGVEAVLIVLDERSCRSPSAARACRGSSGEPDLAPTLPASVRALAGLRDPVSPACLAAIADPTRTMLGRTQRELLFLVLRYFPARFKFVVSEVPMTRLYALPYDRWEGYAAERETILRFIAGNRIPNVVFVAADLHATVLSPLSVELDGETVPAATEIVTGPIAVDPLLSTLSSYPAFDPAYVKLLPPLAGVECADIEQMAYGVAEVDQGEARLAVKNKAGEILCEKVLGPPR
ncbi:MAG: alkaline phosphatase D family protein [Bryobacteraceae bacterium]